MRNCIAEKTLYNILYEVKTDFAVYIIIGLKSTDELLEELTKKIVFELGAVDC